MIHLHDKKCLTRSIKSRQPKNLTYKSKTSKRLRKKKHTNVANFKKCLVKLIEIEDLLKVMHIKGHSITHRKMLTNILSKIDKLTKCVFCCQKNLMTLKILIARIRVDQLISKLDTDSIIKEHGNAEAGHSDINDFVVRKLFSLTFVNTNWLIL